MKKPTLKQWIEKHNVSSKLMSKPLAIKRAIEHEQLKHELKFIQ